MRGDKPCSQSCETGLQYKRKEASILKESESPEKGNKMVLGNITASNTFGAHCSRW